MKSADRFPDPRALVVAGVMSGTSADGVDVAICRVAPSSKAVAPPRVKLLGYRSFPYSPAVRAAVLAAMDAQRTSTAELSHLHWRLGKVYADCVAATSKDVGLKLQLIACHGQTIYHQAVAAPYLSQPTRCTWQLGEASTIAETLGVAVVSDFRTADLAAGGQGAPLVPMLDYSLFRHTKTSRLLLNLGGIANITALAAGCKPKDVIAFDTGPANMVIDAAMQQLLGKPIDRNGSTAARGRVLTPVLESFKQEAYFAATPPKSCGREEFGDRFVTRFLQACRRASKKPEDAIATATALTATTIVEAYARCCWPHLAQRAPLARNTEMFAAGGGTRNATLMRQLAESFAAFGIRVATTDALGLPSAAKEATAFALLGWLTWHGLPGNLPSVTGARRAVVLGKVTHA